MAPAQRAPPELDLSMKEGAEEKHNREAWMSEELRNDGEKGKKMNRLTYQSFGKEGSEKAGESYFFQFICCYSFS